MGRMDKALSEVSATKSGEEESSHDQETPVPISGSVDSSADSIDFSQLPKLSPDQECLVKNRVLAAQPDAPERAVFKVLRTRVLQRLKTSLWNVLGVTGTGPGEGKTMTAINLAYSLAQNVNQNVILVDLDLRRPSIHSYLGLEPKHDLTNFLDGSESLEKILVRPDENRLAILTNQTTYKDSSEVLSSPKLVSMIHQLKNLGPNTITIIDLPPVMAGDDVLALSPLIDALLLVVAQGSCRRDHLLESYELLKETNILGAVLNRSREKSATSGYYEYY